MSAFTIEPIGRVLVESGARHPRGNTDWPRVGIFAQRAKDRPNRLGVSRCALLKVDGPDGATHQPQWSRELMRGYW